MNKPFKIILFSLILLFNQVAFSQWKLNQISGSEGLSQNTIKSIIQDKNGFIWIGNYHGINKYDGYDMKHYTFSKEANGLSSNLIHSLFEDKDGFIWAGTSDAGINRIDPRTNKVDQFFTHGKGSGSFRNIEKLHQTSSGIIFYHNSGSLRLFKVSEQGKLNIDENIHVLNGQKQFIRSIIPAINGKHWMLTAFSKTKLWLLDINEKENNKASISLKETGVEQLFKEGTVAAIIESGKNTFWILSTQLELLKIQLDDQLKEVTKQYIDLKNTQFEIGNRNLSNLDIQIDKNDRLWIAGDRLLLNYDINSGKTTFLNNNNNYQINHKFFQNLLIDNSNILWLGTMYNGLYNIDLENNTFLNSNEFINISQLQKRKFNKYPIIAISEDKEGNIWMGGQGNAGLAVLAQNELERGISNTSKMPWAINYLNKYKAFQNINLTNIRRFLHDSDDNLWVGSTTGLSKIQKGPSKSNYDIKFFDNIKDSKGSLIQSPVFSLGEDYKKNIWVGYWGSGLVKLTYNFQTESYTSINFQSDSKLDKPISDNFVRDIYEDKDRNIWIGTVSGLNKIEEKPGNTVEFISYLNKPNNKNSLSNNHILDIFQGMNGKLYVGTFGGGLNEITIKSNNELEFKHYTIEDGLPSNVVYQINEDNQGNIWMLHVREISKLNPVTGDISYFDKQDGFEVSEFKDNAMLKTSSGIFVCGGVNGFTFFDPSNLTINENEPQLTLTEFKLFDQVVIPFEEIKGNEILTKSINHTDTIVLPHYLNSIEFGFSSLHYSNPNKNQYKHILEGFNDRWLFSKGNERRFASYTNIPPGNYIFKVFGSNSAGIWTDKPKEILVIIAPPWYLTYWAIALFILIAIAIIYVLTKIRLHQIKLQSELELESALHEKSEEINKMKLQFFTNISHELRTPLTLIIGPLQQIMKGNTDLLYLERLNSIMYKNSVRLLKLINQLLDFRKAESGNLNLLVQEGDLIAFLKEIFTAFEEVSIEKSIKFNYINNQKSLNAWFDNDKIEKILYNLLSNSFKFTPNGKEITLSIELSLINNKEFAIIKVTDEGLGIPKKELDSIFERFYQAKKENNTIFIGSGLGLAYTKRLVEIHKGTIKIESVEKKGTTCTVSIPISKSEYQDSSILELLPKQYDFRFTKKEVKDIKESIITIPSNDKKSEHSSETPTILIVEDNKDLQEYLFTFFSNYYHVITANNGLVGLELAIKHLPDLIISDLMMPKMNGIEMCNNVKTNLNTSHIPVLILTAKAGIENEKEGLETGAEEFILKPFNVEVLKLRVDNILRTKQLWVQKFKTQSSSKSWKELSSKLDQDFLEKSLKIIKKNLDNPDFSVEKFSIEIGISRSALFNKIKSITGQSTSEFIRTIRLKKAANFIKSGKYSITEIVFMVGFSDPKYFRTCFKKQFEKTPSEYLREFKNEL